MVLISNSRLFIYRGNIEYWTHNNWWTFKAMKNSFIVNNIKSDNISKSDIEEIAHAEIYLSDN